MVVAMGELPLTITGTVTRPSAEVEKLWSPLCRELLAPRPARCVCGPHTTLQGRGDPSHPPVGLPGPERGHDLLEVAQPAKAELGFEPRF